MIRTARAVYHRLPLSYANKHRLLNFAIAFFDSLFRDTESYRAWRARQHLRAAVPSRPLRHSESPLFVLESPVGAARMHVHVESAIARGRRLEISGWAFHEQTPLTMGVLLLDDGDKTRRVPLRLGIERGDVHAAWQNDNTLCSGFHGMAVLDGMRPEEVRIEFEVAGGESFRARVHPCQQRVPLSRMLGRAWRAADRRRIARGVSCLLRGDWRYLWDRMVWLGEALEEMAEPQPVGLQAALDLLAREPSDPLPLEDPVDIIIPVYNGLEHLEPLFGSIRRNTRSPHRLIVVDDASPDPQVWLHLQELVREQADVVLLQNETNRGFIGTVNRAATHVNGDFVLLNTDVEVPPNWLERLIAPIREDRTIASTTPFSNAATVCSFPEMNTDNEPFAGLDVERIDRWFARVRADLPEIELPSGVGFCMGINGEAWRHIGPFDEKTFGRGYGEENDWCLRARAAGYRNVMAPNLFVLHKHGGSFEGVSRDSLRARNLRKVLFRYPHYQGLVDAFVRDDPAGPLRRLLTMLLAAGEASQPPILVVDHELGGGANSYRRRMVDERLAAEQPVLLLTARRGASVFREAVTLCCLYRDHAVSFELEHFAALESLFDDHLPLGEIFYNNAVSFERPLALVETLHRLKIATGARLTVAVHDFYPLCPSYNLLNAEGVYCRLPEVETCRACLPRNRFAANPERAQIDAWRAAWGALLEAAEHILCFSEDSRRHVARAFPQCAARCMVRRHTLNVRFARKPKLNYDDPLHVGVVGAIGYPKGAKVVADLARYMLEALPEARVTVIGVLENAPSLPNLTVTGPYRPENLPDLLERHGINVCFVPSISPETFSYVTEELMALDVPIACFDIGAPAERIREYNYGTTIESLRSDVIFETLLARRPYSPTGAP